MVRGDAATAFSFHELGVMLLGVVPLFIGVLVVLVVDAVCLCGVVVVFVEFVESVVF